MAARPTYEKEFYYPSNLRSLMRYADTYTDEQKAASKAATAAVRKEYTRLRDIAQKRLKRLGSSKFAESQTYKMNVSHYPKLRDIKTPEELAYRLSDLSRFIESPLSTVTGQKSQMQKALATLHSTVDKDGYPKEAYLFVNEDNFIAFTEFMDEWRSQHLDGLYDSGEAADAFAVMDKHGISASQIQEDFEFWLENREDAEKLRKSQKSTGDPDALKKQLDNYRKRKSRR